MLDENPDAVRCADGSRFVLAIFGKHPAWSDHLEDIGIDTPSLAEFKRWLYTDGIRSNLDTGAWERLSDERKITEWNHRLFMKGPKGMLIAKLWASSDGRGRRSYPMVAAIHLPTTRLPADLAPLFEVLDKVRDDCASSATQEEVRNAAAKGRAHFQNAVKSLSPLPELGPDEDVRRQFVTCIGKEQLQRVLHVMATDLANFDPSNRSKKLSEIRSKTFRLPVPALNSEKWMMVWHSFFQPYLRSDAIWTAVHPVSAPWADIHIGNLDPDFVYHLKVSSTENPMISEIPYHISPENSDHFSVILNSFVIPPFVLPSLNRDSASPGMLGSVMGKLFRRST